MDYTPHSSQLTNCMDFFVNLAIMWSGIFCTWIVGLIPLFRRILCYLIPALCQALSYLLEIPTGELDRRRPFLLLLSLVERTSASLPLIFFYFQSIRTKTFTHYQSCLSKLWQSTKHKTLIFGWSDLTVITTTTKCI